MQFLKTLLFVFVTAISAYAQSRPNVIIFFADDLRADALGCYGNSYIKTPTIDSLARHGVRFANTYIQGSHHGALCAPSRAMLLTGKSYHRIKDKMAGQLTLAKKLQAEGYVTYMTGKWHNEPEVVADGFDYARNVMFGGMSDHFQVYCRDLLPDGTFSDMRYKGFSTDIFTDTMVDFVNQHDTDKPFFMYMPFTAPHDPRSPMPDYAAMYKDVTMPLPPNFMPVHPFSFGHPMGVRDEYLAAYPRTPEVIREQWKDYAGLITHLDDGISRVITALKKRGMDKNTLIIFLSDNGLAMGSHGLVGKQSTYEHCMNVPMIFSGLNIPENQTTDAFVYTIDIFPTISQLLGVSVTQGIDGQAFTGVLENPATHHRDAIFLSYMQQHRAIRVGDYKLIRYAYVDKTVLYNLKDDPYELVDLSTRPEMQPIINQLMAELKKQQALYGDTAPLTVAEPLPLEWDYHTLERQLDPWQPRYIIDKYFKE